MLEKVFHLLSGYAEFEVWGDAARFFNIAAKSGFGLWGFSRKEGRALACVKAREYRRLRPVSKRSGARLRLLKKRGLPFQAMRLWKRKGLIAGSVCGAALYVFLSGFVWGVSVTGTEFLTERPVLEAAAACGVYVGSGKSGLNPRHAARGILTRIPEVSWASVNTDGCFVEIVVREGEAKPDITDKERWSNIVAAREGKIIAVEAEQGRPEVELGEAVEKGQLLISGLYQEEIDPYSPPPNGPLETVGAARGSVKAETYREFTVQVSSRKKALVPTGKRKSNGCLKIFGLRLPLGLNTLPSGAYKASREVCSATALGTELPISLEWINFEFFQEEERALTEEEQKEAALLKLRDAQKASLPRESRVVREELSYSFVGNLCILSAKCRCQEEIGEMQEILVE